MAMINCPECNKEISDMALVCPICGYPMQFRYKNAYGLRLHICTNEPEVCGFMTNEYKAGKMSIIKCDQCRDGYLIVRQAKNNDYFLGCRSNGQLHITILPLLLIRVNNEFPID